jgi:diguanylate cyclase
VPWNAATRYILAVIAAGVCMKWAALRDALMSPPVVGSLAAALVFGTMLRIDRLESAAFRDRERGGVVERVALLRQRVEQSLGRHLGALETTEALVLANAGMDRDTFHVVGVVLQQGLPAITEIQLSPGGIVEMVYPPEREAAVRGLNLLTLPDQSGVVKETIAGGVTRVAGPMRLRQGGMGIVARNPVFIEAASVPRRFWGFVTIILDLDRFLASVAGLTTTPGLVVALRGKDGLGAKGDVFLGSPADFTGDVITTDVSLPNGTWQLAARPEAGWSTRRPQSLWFTTLAAALSAGIGVLSYFVRARGIALKRMATTDQLTGAPNRRAFLANAEAEVAPPRRHGRPLAVIALDVDHFKRVNDTWGHAAGDRVLVEVARQVMRTLRPGDELGRLGGEEFAVVLPESDAGQAAVVADRLRAMMADTPIPVGD